MMNPILTEAAANERVSQLHREAATRRRAARTAVQDGPDTSPRISRLWCRLRAALTVHQPRARRHAMASCAQR